eukprot:gene11306-12488_t
MTKNAKIKQSVEPSEVTKSIISIKCHALPIPEISQPIASSLVAVLSIISFFNSLEGDFVFDDNEAILSNKDVSQETSIFSIFKHDFWGSDMTSKTSHKSYRPFTVWTFRLNYWAAGGYKPLGFHLVNIMLHSLNSLMVLRVYSVLFGNIFVSRNGSRVFAAPKISLLAAILFATHPIHTENVAGIVGRADLFCAFFFFASFLSYARIFSSALTRTQSLLPETVSTNSVFACVVFALLAILSKEQGITVLGFCIVFDCMKILSVKKRAIIEIYKTGKAKESEEKWLLPFFKRIFILIFTSFLLLIWRMKLMGSNPPQFQEADNPSAFMTNRLLRVVNYNYIYSLNIWLLLNPWWLCFDWAMGCIPLITKFNDIRLVAPTLFWITLLLLTYKSIRNLHCHFSRTLLLCIGFTIIPFLPSTNIFFTVGFVIAERNLYLSSVGFIGIVALGMLVACQNTFIRKIFKICLPLLIGIFILKCHQRSRDWLSEEALFKAGEAVCPSNAKVHYNIANILSGRGETKSAISYYRESIRLNPTYDQPLNNLGNILQKAGNLLESEKLLEKAVAINLKFATGWMNLGVTKTELKKYIDAEKCYLNALSHRKRYPDAQYNLANLYLQMKEYQKALKHFKAAIEMKQDHESSWLNLLLLLDNLGLKNESFVMSKKVEKILPESPAIFYTIGNMYGNAGFYEQAERYYLKAIQLNPKESTYYGNLGVLYHRWKKLSLAEDNYKRSLQLNPNNQMTIENYRKFQQMKK